MTEPIFVDATEAEIAFVAGVYEGEGCVRTRPSGAQTYSTSVEVQMTDVDVLERVAGIVGYGSVKGPYQRAYEGSKLMYTWGLYNWDHVECFYENVRPWLGERRLAQWAEVMSHATPIGLRGRGGISRAQTHCKRGHELNEENTYYDPVRGYRQCRKCIRWRYYLEHRVTSLSAHKAWHVRREFTHPNCVHCGTGE